MDSKESEERKSVQQGEEWLSCSKAMKTFEMAPEPCSQVERENPCHHKKEKGNGQLSWEQCSLGRGEMGFWSQAALFFNSKT